MPSLTSASSAGVVATCCVTVSEVSRLFVAAGAGFTGKVIQRVAWAVVVTVTSVVGMSSITTFGVCQTMRRLVWRLALSSVVVGVKIIRGLGAKKREQGACTEC